MTDPKSQMHIDGIKKLFADSTSLRIVDISTNANYMIIRASSPDNPGEYHLYNAAQRRLDLVQSGHPELGGRKFSRTRVEQFPARGGAMIDLYVTNPARGFPQADQAPLVVKPHGGPEARDYLDYDSSEQFLAARGFRVIQPYFRGSEGKGRDQLIA